MFFFNKFFFLEKLTFTNYYEIIQLVTRFNRCDPCPHATLHPDQAPAGSQDWSRDPGLFWIPIPIPENFFQNRDRDQNRDLPFSSQLMLFGQTCSYFGN